MAAWILDMIKAGKEEISPVFLTRAKTKLTHKLQTALPPSPLPSPPSSREQLLGFLKSIAFNSKFVFLSNVSLLVVL